MEDAYRALPPFNGPKVLDLHSVKEFPETHAWISADNYPTVDIESLIPVVDLDDKNAIEVISHACKTLGIFHIVNHNIKKELLDEMNKGVEGLFGLPMEQKLKAKREPDGVSGYGKARNSANAPKLTWYEGFCIVGSPLEHARKLWPTDYQKFCDLIEEYEKEMRNLAERLLCLILGSLGLAKDDLNWVGPNGEYEGESSILQLNSYPACPEPDRAMGLAPHTDSGILTILHQNNTSGLQMLHEGNWVNIPPVPGALIVNVADLLHILSNGLLVCVFHRAMVNLSQYRFSIAYFYGPPTSTKVAPSPKLVDPNSNPPLYKPVTWKEYVATRAQYFEKGLSTISISRPVNESIDANDHPKAIDAKDDPNAQHVENDLPILTDSTTTNEVDANDHLIGV